MKMENTKKVRQSNTGKKGITFRANRNRFEAQFTFMGGKQYIGSFKNLEEAVKARNSFINSLK